MTIDYSFKYPHLAILTQEKSYDKDDNEDEDEEDGDDDDDDDDDDEDEDDDYDDDDDKGDDDVPHKFILKVLSMERSTLVPLYSIDIDETECRIDQIILEDVTILLENNLIRVSTPGMIFVFDATTIEDRDSVLTSKTEIPMDGGVRAFEETLVLFNKFLGVRKQQDTITYYNFWK